jgi:hypothetical protein
MALSLTSSIPSQALYRHRLPKGNPTMEEVIVRKQRESPFSFIKYAILAFSSLVCFNAARLAWPER